MCLEAKMKICVQSLWVRTHRTPKIWEGKKRAKFGTISDFDREYCWNGSRYQKIGKASDQLQPLPRWMNFGPLTKKVIGAHVDPSKINTARAV